MGPKPPLSPNFIELEGRPACLETPDPQFGNQGKTKKIDVLSVKTIQNSSTPFRKKKKHQRTKLVSTFTCMHCSKSFVRKLTLQAHIARHTNYCPYKCDSCPKQFATSRLLTLHKRTHTSMYRCQVCYKSFNVRSKLQRHIVTHFGDRPFACMECGHRFKDKSNLTAHMVVHSSQRRFACKACGKSCNTNSKLTEHMRTHDNKRTEFKCELCSKSYRWKTNLVAHLRKGCRPSDKKNIVAIT